MFFGIRDGKNPDPGSGINIPDPQHWILHENITEILRTDQMSRQNIFSNFLTSCTIWDITGLKNIDFSLLNGLKEKAGPEESCSRNVIAEVSYFG